MSAYYNENDPKAAAWLRELIKIGLIADGEVDERSIVDIRPKDIKGFNQCHFFAGIGGWSHALRLAGWPNDRAVWTGSCPCQPFSAAGKGGGFDGERHLWPYWHYLIEQCRPATIFGEQVASPDGLKWLDLVYADLENTGYAVGAADLCAAGVGAPHIRQRLYFVAPTTRGNTSAERQQRSRQHGLQSEVCGAESLEHSESNGRVERRAESSRRGVVCGRGESSMEHAAREQVGFPGCTWFDGRPVDWIDCLDGKQRPVEPGTFPLAHGVSDRVGLLRGYGNAIVPQVAQAFIESYLETC